MHGRDYMRQQRQNPEFRTSEVQRMREYNRRPDVRARKIAYAREQANDPVVQARRREWRKEYNQRPEIRAREKARYENLPPEKRAEYRERAYAKRKTPEARAKHLEYVMRRYWRLGGDKPRRYLKQLAWAQAWRCPLCDGDLPAEIHVHHRYPVNPPVGWPSLPPGYAPGSVNDVRNLAAVCATCNIRAQNYITEDGIESYKAVTGEEPSEQREAA